MTRRMNHPAWFILPYWTLFLVFVIIPVIAAVFLSFTYFNAIQTPIGSRPYQGDRKVTLSQMPDQNKLILANASNQAPDLAIGGTWGGSIDDSIFPVELKIKYVKAYERSE